jgi:hypothetical protein
MGIKHWRDQSGWQKIPGLFLWTVGDYIRDKSVALSVSGHRQADAEIEVTLQMIEAGVDRLCDLLEAGTGSAYVVSEVFQAMWKARVGTVASP